MPRLCQRPARAFATAGDDAIAWAESIGWDAESGRGYYELDEWQKFCIRGLLSEDESAQLCALVVLIIVARQNGKNVILEVVELYAFYVMDLPYILHTAHLQETTADHMANLWAAISSDDALSSITRQVVANGKERIYRTDWCQPATGKKKYRCQIRFRTRSKKGGRGGSPQMVVFDEALHLLDKQINALLPSLAAQSMRGDAPLLIYTSSAPVEESDVLRRVRAAILAGEIPDAFMAEWSAVFAVQAGETREQALVRVADDEDALFDANPGMGVRISPVWIRANERSTMSVDGYCVERLSVTFEDDDRLRIVTKEQWAAAEDNPADSVRWPDGLPVVGRRALMWDVNPDSSWATVGWVGERADGVFHGEIVESKAGTGWVAERLVQYAKGAGPLVVAVGFAGGTPAEALVADVQAAFDAAGVRLVAGKDGNLIKVSGQSYAAGCVEWFNRTTAGTLRHLPSTQLTSAVDGAVWRDTGETRVFDRKTGAEITPLCAHVVALRALELAPVKKPWSGAA